MAIAHAPVNSRLTSRQATLGNTSLQISASERFLKAYRKAIFSLKGLTEGAVHDFVNLHRSDSTTLLRSYDRLAQLPGPVIEIDLSGGCRAVAHYSKDRLILLDMGEHEVVGRYDSAKLIRDLINNVTVPSQFWPEHQAKFFVSHPDQTVPFHYPQEISPEWMYFLTDEQQGVFDDIADSLLAGERNPHFLLGGPGTGKTCILLNLLKYFVDADDDDYRVGLVISDELKGYIESATRMNISTHCVRPNVKVLRNLNILLVDDPKRIEHALRYKATNRNLSIVLAFDPLQLPEDLTDAQLNELTQDFDAKQHILTQCYRQKEKVGQTTKHVVDTVAASTPFLAESKVVQFREEREYLTQVSNNLIFVNPHGYTQTYPEASVRDFQTEVQRILSSDWLMWKHWPGLLVVLGDCELSEEVNTVMIPLFAIGYVKILQLSQVEEVKGLEFQHVFIFLNRDEFTQIQNGFKGSGRSTYRSRTLLRIPFSRAKDSVVTFAVGGE